MCTDAPSRRAQAHSRSHGAELRRACLVDIRGHRYDPAIPHHGHRTAIETLCSDGGRTLGALALRRAASAALGRHCLDRRGDPGMARRMRRRCIEAGATHRRSGGRQDRRAPKRRAPLPTEMQSHLRPPPTLANARNRSEAQQRHPRSVSPIDASGFEALSSPCVGPVAYAPHPPRSGPPFAGAA